MDIQRHFTLAMAHTDLIPVGGALTLLFGGISALRYRRGGGGIVGYSQGDVIGTPPMTGPLLLGKRRGGHEPSLFKLIRGIVRLSIRHAALRAKHEKI